MANWFTRLFGKKTSDFVKEEGRYYFYDNCCSFKLEKDDIIKDIEENNGLKHTLNTRTISQIIIEIRHTMPTIVYPFNKEELVVAGYPCLGAYLKTPLGLLTYYFINCGEYVVQVDLPNQNTSREMSFLNSFRIENVTHKNEVVGHIDYVNELEAIIYDYCESAYKCKPTFRITKNTNFKRNLNFDGIDMAEIGMAFEKKFSLKEPASDHPINQRLANDTDYTVEYFLSAYELSDVREPNQTAQDSQHIDDDHEWIDLGLQSGTLWATCNVGANKPEEYGDYFAWGETKPKTEYNWTTYRYSKGGKDFMAKYVLGSSYGSPVDKLRELLPEDDAATVNWGASWQMPSKEQIEELINKKNTSIRWDNINGVSGKRITSRTNGNSIFIPAAGIRGDANTIYEGSDCVCWSRTLNYYNSYEAEYLLLYIGNDCCHYNKRGYGFTVRPVRIRS